MKTQRPVDLRCASTARSLNAFMDGELPEASSGELLQHLKDCPSCRQELDIRKTLRSRLKTAVSTAQPSPYLGTRVMSQVRAQARKPQWLQRTSWIAASSAALVLMIGGGVAYVRRTVDIQDAYISGLVHTVAHVMRPGLADHVHCSVFRKYSPEPPAIEKLHQQIGPEYTELVDAVRSKVPADFKVYLAHECGYEGRQFVHIGLHDGSRQISLVLARKEHGETFRNSNLQAVISQGGLRVYGTSADRFQIAGFETATHLAYIVSDISEHQTRELMLAIAPQIQSTLAALKG